MHKTRSETLGKTLGETLWRDKSRQDSRRDSLRESFFYAGDSKVKQKPAQTPKNLLKNDQDD